MNINNLKQIKHLLNKELSNSMKELGTENYTILCQLKSIIDLLIKNIEYPEENEKLKRLMNPDDRSKK